MQYGASHQVLRIEPVHLHDAAFHASHADGSPDTMPTYMDYNLFCGMADQLTEGAELQLQGADDPLLHLHFFRMVRYASGRGLCVSTTTTLTVFPEYCARECAESGLQTMYIALDAPDADSYFALYGKNRFQKVVRNIRRLISARSAAQSVSPKVWLGCTLTRGNLDKLTELIRFAVSEGMDGVRVQFPHEEKFAAVPSHYFQTMRDIAAEETLLSEHAPEIARQFALAIAAAGNMQIRLRLPEMPANDVYVDAKPDPEAA